MYNFDQENMQNFINKLNKNYSLQQCTNVKCDNLPIIYFQYENSIGNYIQAFMCITFDVKYLKILHIHKDYVIHFDNQHVTLKLQSWQVDHNHSTSSFSNSRIYLHFVHDTYFHTINRTSRIYLQSNLSTILHEIFAFSITGDINYDLQGIITQYDESDINFVNRLLHMHDLKWECKHTGGIHIYKEDAHDMQDIKVTNLSFGMQSVPLQSFNYYDTHDHHSQIRKSNDNINEHNHKHMHEDNMITEQRYFDNQNKYENVVKFNQQQNIPKMQGSFYCDKYVQLNSKYAIRNKDIYEPMEFKVVAIRFISYYESNVNGYQAYICDKVSCSEYTIPKPGLQTATVNNTYMGQSNYLNEDMCCTAIFHFDTRHTRVPIYISSPIAHQYGQTIMPVKQNTMISVYFLSLSYPVFVNSIFNVENQIHTQFRENHCKYGIITHSTEPSAHEICSPNAPNDTGNIESRMTSITINNENDREIIEIQPAKDISIIIKKGNSTTTIEDGDHSLSIRKGNWINTLEDGRLDIKVNGNINITSEDTINIKAPKIHIETDEFKLKSSAKVSIESVNITQKADNNTCEFAVNSMKCESTNTKAAIAKYDTGDMSITSGIMQIKTGDFNIEAAAYMLKSAVTNITSAAVTVTSEAVSITAAIVDIEGMMMCTMCIIEVLISEAAIIDGVGSGIYVAGIP